MRVLSHVLWPEKAAKMNEQGGLLGWSLQDVALRDAEAPEKGDKGVPVLDKLPPRLASQISSCTMIGVLS